MASVNPNDPLWKQKQDVDDAVIKAKEKYAEAEKKGDKKAMEAAHKEANEWRSVIKNPDGTTYQSYSATDKKTGTLDYAYNYSPGESTDRPPSWLDWDDDGQLDTWKNGGIYDSSGNRLDAKSPEGYSMGGWRVDPGSWDYYGQNSGGFDPISTHQPPSSYTPYTPPSPPPPPPPPAAVPSPGVKPEFTYESQREVTKYEYVYGLKDLQIRGKEYAPKSIYVSKPVEVEGNVMQVSLKAVEEHPLFSSLTGEAATRQTSIEYYISYVNDPTSEDWHAILPEGQTDIKSELLMFDNARLATLRFPALTISTPPPKVYKDGIEFSDWAFTGGGTGVQLLVDRNPDAIYTIDYIPNNEIIDPWTIDIYQRGIKTVTVTDVFPNGTNHNKTVILSKYPYIRYDIVNGVSGTFDPNGTYRPIQVKLTNARIAGPNRSVIQEVLPYDSTTTQAAYTLNITDYKTKQWKAPRPYSTVTGSQYKAFEYWNESNKLYFSETFNKSDILTNQELNHGDAQIEVTYECLVSNFRVKIILRRNGPGMNSLSPIVSEYSLKFKVMK